MTNRFAIQWAIAATVMLVIVSSTLWQRWELFDLREESSALDSELIDLQESQIDLLQAELLRDEMQFKMLYPGWKRGMVLHMKQENGLTSFYWEW